MHDGQRFDVWRAGVWRGRRVGRENGAWDPQRDDVHTPRSGDKTTRNFTASMRQLKCVVGDADVLPAFAQFSCCDACTSLYHKESMALTDEIHLDDFYMCRRAQEIEKKP